MQRVFPSITTHSSGGNSWREKILEVEELRIQRVGLFLTGVTGEERQEVYARLKELRSRMYFEIPFVHAVSDMLESEFCALMAQFGTQAFNLHPVQEYPLVHPLSVNIRKRIFIENATSWRALTDLDMEGFAGVCIDLAHLEETRRNDEIAYRHTLKIVKKYGVGANHVGGIRAGVQHPDRPWIRYQSHEAANEQEFDYLFRFPSALFSPLCAIELQNPLKEQIQFAQRLGRMIATLSVIEALQQKAA
jgi:hypothetical protein